jgi:rRNA maturation endonuclease Nob1
MVDYIYTKTIDCGGHVKINSIPYCSECSKVIDKAWDYCPFCGDKLWYKDGKEDEDGREE